MRLSALAWLGLVSLPLAAQAGGYAVDEQDAAATGRGGTAGARTGPSAAYYNPAGLMDVGPLAVEVGATALAPAVSVVDPGGGKTYAATPQVFLPPYAYLAHSQDNFAVGLSFNAPFGLGIGWPGDFPDRFEIQSVTLQTLAIQAAAAYRIVPSLSVGVTVGAAHTSLDILKALDFVSQEGSTHILTSGWGLVASAGVRYAVSDVLQFGLSGAIPTPTAMSGVARFSNVPDTFAPLTPDQDVTTHLTLPARLRLAASAHPLAPLRVDVDLEYTFWSAFQSLDIHFADPSPPTASQAKNWHDAFTARLGGEYEVTDVGAFRAGFLYDQAASPVNTMTPDAPDGDRFGISLGAGREVTRGLRIDLAYAFLLLASRTSTEPNYPARYSGHAHAIGMSLTYTLPVAEVAARAPEAAPSGPPVPPVSAPPPPPPTN